ncbi:hypothetical protein Lalb_Chr15g0078621 [Lupinus albus]|uniref:Uncharacterized protein n=1 Tax=Lupinus albus TaxID=3870 RepID=A0A6A4P0F1_LUPAL|nr:hypothetical protein Lalb_Chr15g0078621 [Lupinus albus]
MILNYLLIFEDKCGTKNDPIFVTFCCFEFFLYFFIGRTKLSVHIEQLKYMTLCLISNLYIHILFGGVST